MDLRLLLTQEFSRRHRRNPRYSFRAFARSLGVDNSSLLRVVHQRKRLTDANARALGQKLGLTDVQISQAIAHEHAETILSLVPHRAFQADSRWLAMMSGIPIDDVNIALHRLIHSRRLTMHSASHWRAEEC